jgi:Carboxypeptidase regulatory-like domain
MAGVVREDSSGKPRSGVDVILLGTGRQTITDQRGRFVLADLKPGPHLALFRQPGYRPVRLVVQLVSGDTVWANATLVLSVVELEPLTVTAEPKAPHGIGVEAFEERRKLGFGKFMDSLDLQRHEQLHVSDLFFRIPGIAVVRPPDPANHYKHVAVTTRTNRGFACPLQVVVDGVVMYYAQAPSAWTNWERTVDLDEFLMTGLQAVEIYRSAAEVPVEYGGAGAGCGAILIWTKHPGGN